MILRVKQIAFDTKNFHSMSLQGMDIGKEQVVEVVGKGRDTQERKVHIPSYRLVLNLHLTTPTQMQTARVYGSTAKETFELFWNILLALDEFDDRTEMAWGEEETQLWRELCETYPWLQEFTEGSSREAAPED